MNESQIPENQLFPRPLSRENIRFIQDEHGERKPRILSDDEVESFKNEAKEKQRGVTIVMCPGHVQHISDQLLYLLSTHSINQDVVLIQSYQEYPNEQRGDLPKSNQNHIIIQQIWTEIPWPFTLQERIKELEPIPFIIRTREELNDNLLLSSPQTTYGKNDRYHTPKNQKSGKYTSTKWYTHKRKY